MYLPPVSIVGPLRLLCSSQTAGPRDVTFIVCSRDTRKHTQPGAAWVGFLMAKAEAGHLRLAFVRKALGTLCWEGLRVWVPWASATLCEAEIARAAGEAWLCRASKGRAGALCLSRQEKHPR